jgi:hypothetical protein
MTKLGVLTTACSFSEPMASYSPQHINAATNTRSGNKNSTKKDHAAYILHIWGHPIFVFFAGDWADLLRIKNVPNFNS